MSIRIRFSKGRLVALCAAKTEAHVGDIYLDEGHHRALYRKFEADFIKEGRMMAPFRPAPSADVDRDEKVKRLAEIVHKVLVLVDNSEDLRGGTYYPWPALRSALAEVDAEGGKS